MALGRVFKRGEIYHIAFSYKGREYRRSANTKSKREAESILAYWLGTIARGAFHGFEEVRSTYTLVEMVDDYLHDYAQRGMRDVKNLRYKSNAIRKFFVDTAVEAVDERLIDRYIKDRLQQGKKHATINRELQLMISAFRLAKRKKLITEIPYIQRFREDNARQGFFERAEMDAIVALLLDHLHDVVRFAYYTGWRKEEILTLEWRDIHDDVIRLRPEIAKNKDGRLLILVGELATIIERRRVARFELCPYVFHRQGKRIIKFYYLWRKARKSAGLPNKYFHDTRRTAVRNMDRAGVPREVAKRISGHKTDLIYSRYRIVNEEDIRQGLERTQAYLHTQQSTIVQIGHNTHTDEKEDSNTKQSKSF
jgi:integrase